MLILRLQISISQLSVCTEFHHDLNASASPIGLEKVALTWPIGELLNC